VNFDFTWFRAVSVLVFAEHLLWRNIMRRFDSTMRAVLVFAIIAQLGIHTVARPAMRASQQPRPRRIAVWGSSVAFGTGDETNK